MRQKAKVSKNFADIHDEIKGKMQWQNRLI